jgi:hypothetical protein
MLNNTDLMKQYTTKVYSALRTLVVCQYNLFELCNIFKKK